MNCTVQFVAGGFPTGKLKPFRIIPNREVLAISSEEDDGRIYRSYAGMLREAYPASGTVFDGMAAGFYAHRPVWLTQNLGLEVAHLGAEVRGGGDVSARRQFVLTWVQPGFMDGSVSTLAPIFATAFATQNTRTTFLVGLAASVGAGISMGFTEAAHDDGVLSGRGSPWKRRLASGVMKTLGGLGHAFPFLTPNFLECDICGNGVYFHRVMGDYLDSEPLYGDAVFVSGLAGGAGGCFGVNE